MIYHIARTICAWCCWSCFLVKMKYSGLAAHRICFFYVAADKISSTILAVLGHEEGGRVGRYPQLPPAGGGHQLRVCVRVCVFLFFRACWNVVVFSLPRLIRTEVSECAHRVRTPSCIVRIVFGRTDLDRIKHPVCVKQRTKGGGWRNF